MVTIDRERLISKKRNNKRVHGQQNKMKLCSPNQGVLKRYKQNVKKFL